VDVIGIGYDVATGDLDEDLDNDLVVSTQTGVTVLLNEGGVSFAAPIDYPVETGQFEPAGSIALEDFDGDFDVDIAAVSNDLFLFLNDGNGDFTELISYPGPPGGQAATAGDVNADGQPDLAVLGFGQEGEGHVFILLNDNGSFSTAEPYRVNAFSNSLVLQDFDEDAWPDLAVACDHTVALLQNDREGNFRDDDAYPVPRSSFFMAVGDLNGDDAQDLAVAAPEAAVVLLNNGDGTLQEAIPYRTGTGLYSIAAGDLDGDGHLDLATSDTAGVSVLFNEGDGSFDMSTSYPVEENPYSIAIGDLNCDAHPDIVTTHVAWTPPPEFGSVTVLLNKGSGEFSPAVNYYGSSPEAFSLAIADVNGDAAPDIAVAAIDLWILFNLGDGVFMDPVTYDVPTAVSVSAGDLDGDGDNDLSLGVDGDPNNGVLVLLNEGAATFSTGGTYPILGSPVSLACADIDGDHDLDLAVTNYEYHNVAILLNDGQAGFEGWISYGTGSSPSSVAVSDLNGDGSPDLAVANAPIFSGETEISILLSLCTGPPCSTLADCADLDRDGVRDDPCTWWECSAGSCMGTPTLPGDLGGSFGACAPDEATDGNDHFHALNCFANQTTMGGPGYPCEDQPPQAFNVDAGGPFGNCAPDGVCDAHDAFHAINAFAGTSTCACPTSAPSLPPSQRLRPRQP
jgi:hypothetical protein